MLWRSFPGSIRHVLNELPRTLDQTYKQISEGLDEEKWEYALCLFQCLAVACHPLQVKELAEVLAVEVNTGIPRLNVAFISKNQLFLFHLIPSYSILFHLIPSYSILFLLFWG